MITISQKCQYALRGVYEMAKRASGEPVAAADLAAAQAIPPRFLELIFNELRQAGLIQSFRGPQGGYTLTRKPSEITVGQIIRLADGPTNFVKCVSGNSKCPFTSACPFREVWDDAATAIDAVFDRTNIQDLLDREKAQADGSSVAALDSAQL